jgi:hypothetical protein
MKKKTITKYKYLKIKKILSTKREKYIWCEILKITVKIIF